MLIADWMMLISLSKKSFYYISPMQCILNTCGKKAPAQERAELYGLDAGPMRALYRSLAVLYLLHGQTICNVSEMYVTLSINKVYKLENHTSY